MVKQSTQNTDYKQQAEKINKIYANFQKELAKLKVKQDELIVQYVKAATDEKIKRLQSKITSIKIDQ